MVIVLRRKLLSIGFRAGVKGITLALSASVLWSCGGESGINIGGGQSADPVVVDYPLFYVKRPLPIDEDMGEFAQTDFREVVQTEYGADLMMRERASSSANEVNLTRSITGGFGDVRDVSTSSDGERVLFSMRAPIDPDADEEDQPTWNIWEYEVGSGNIRRVMLDDITAEEGHDIGAHYLPDDRIVFTSTRQNQSVAKLTIRVNPSSAPLMRCRMRRLLFYMSCATMARICSKFHSIKATISILWYWTMAGSCSLAGMPSAERIRSHYIASILMVPTCNLCMVRTAMIRVLTVLRVARIASCSF